MGLSIKRNAAWMFLGQGGYALGQWLIIVILARLGGPTLVGEFALALAITAPIIIFSQLQMRQIQVVDATGRYAFADYRAVRLGTTALALLAIAAIALLGGYSAPVAAVILAIGLGRGIESLSDIYYGLAHRHERLDRVAQSMLLRGVAGVAALGAVLALTGSLLAGLLVQAAVWAAIWWWFDRRITLPWRRGAAIRYGPGDRHPLRRRLGLAWLGLPLGGTMLLGTLNVNVPRYVVEGFLGLEALGIFAALAYFVHAGRTVIDAVCNAASPRLARMFAGGETGPFRQLILQLAGTGVLLGLAGVLAAALFGAPLLGLLYGPAFAAHAELLVMVMVVGLVHYTVAPFGYGLTAMHRFRVQLVIQGLSVGVNLLACLLLVPRYGLMGALDAWLAALVCRAAIELALSARYLRRAPDEASAGRVARPPRRVGERPL